MKQIDPKIIICGTGRAGTTLLMRILTVAGMNTGFKPRHFHKVEANVGRAGLEKVPNRENAHNLPLVLKTPHFVDVLPDLLAEDWFPIGLAIVPMRNLDAAAKSRKIVRDRAITAGQNPDRAPGGLWKTDSAENQHLVLAEQFYRTLEPLVAAEIPVLPVSFPRFAKDIEYFDSTIGATLERESHVDRARLRAAHIQECKPNLISEQSTG